MNKIQVTLMLILVISISSLSLSASDDFGAMLAQADEVKSSDPRKFSELLDSIDSQSLSPEQQLLFTYLSGYRMGFSGDRQSARINYLEVYNKAESDLRYRALAQAVSSYSFSGMWYEGIQKLNTLVQEMDKIQSQSTKEQVIVTIAIFYNRAGENALANRFGETLALMGPSQRNSCILSAIIVESRLELSSEPITPEYYQESRQSCQVANEKVIEAIIIGRYANYLLKNRQIEQALSVSALNQEFIESTQYPSLISGFYSIYADASFQAGQYQKAQELAQKAIEMQQSNNYQKAALTSYKILSQLAELNDDYALALTHHKKYVEAQSGYTETAKERKFIIQQANHEAIEKNNRIDLLDQQNALLRAESELAKKRAENNRLALALACSLVILLFLWLFRSKKLQTKLRYLAETDDLTGISNRHHFKRLTDAALLQSKNSKQPICFILFDLDHFKKVNDNFGHQIGDWALKNSVVAAKSVCRGNDVIGRMGGEEFAILLPGCTLEKGLQIAELCRSAIEQIDTSPTNKEFRITASFGICDSTTCGYYFDKLFAGADAALYKSKHQGRNQIYQYEHSSA